jgi:photosystem II stability/assembly factor-like uncharacterized protein
MKKLVFVFAFLFIISFHISAQNIWQALDSPGGSNVNKLFKVTDSIHLIGVQFDGSFYRTTNAGTNWEKVFQGSHPNNIGNKAVRCFAFNSNQEILASTFTNGILRSTDQGATWIGTGGAGGEGMVNTNSGIMFGYDNVSQNWQFSRSLDSGKTWSYLPHPWTGNSVYSISSRNDIVYIGSRDSIIFSSDFGNTWYKYGNSFSASGIYSLIFLEENEVLAGTNNGVFYTSDSGISWVLRNSGIPGISKLVRNFQIISDRIYGIGKFGLIYSTDKGLSWQHYNNLSFQKDIYAAAYTDDQILICTYTGVYKIIPEQWVYSSQGIYAHTPYKLIRANNGDLLFNTSIGLFSSTNDGFNWNCLELENFFGGCKDITIKENLYFLMNKAGDFYISSDNGASWSYTGNKPFASMGMEFSKLNNSIYACFNYYPSGQPPTDAFYISPNFGASWSLRGLNPTSMLTVLTGDTIITKQLNGSNYQNLGLQKSNNQGGSWYDFNSGLPNLDVKTVSVDMNGNYYTSTDKGIFKCNKAANYWNRFSDSTLTNVNSITFNQLNHCIVVNDGKIFASVTGNKWDDCSQGLGTNTITKIISDSSGYFYAFEKSGRIFRTVNPSIINQLPNKPELLTPTNGGEISADTVIFNWSASSPLVIKYNFQLSEDSLFTIAPDSIVSDSSLTIYNLDNEKKYYWRVKAFNELGWSVFSEVAEFSTKITGIDILNEVILEYSLEQNYPNPFNPSTSIQYAINSRQFVTLKVFDVLGKEVGTLVNEYRDAGGYEVEFKSSVGSLQLATGIYYYQLRAGDFVETKKMILLK